MAKNEAFIGILSSLRDKPVRVYLSCGRDLFGKLKSVGDVVILERGERRTRDGLPALPSVNVDARPAPQLWVDTSDIVAVEVDE